MKKNALVKMLVLVLCVALLLPVMAACGGDKAPTKYSVTFNYNYTGAPAAVVIQVDKDANASITDPTREGYTFDGWYDAATGGQKVVLASTKITANTTFYARWTKKEVVGTKYSVTFKYNYTGAPADVVLKVDKGANATNANPTRDGYNFLGWFTAATGGTLVNLATTAINADTVLYAQWEKAEDVSNDTTPLVIASLQFDGKFSPYFYTSQPDGDIAGLTQISMIGSDPQGAPVGSDVNGVRKYPNLAKSFTQVYDAETNTTTYKFVLNNDVTYPDGSLVTVNDVLFNFHVYSDPLYNGSTTLYTTPILGMQEYRNQASNANIEKTTNWAKAMIALAGAERPADAEYTQEQYDLFKSLVEQGKIEFAKALTSDIVISYAGLYGPELGYDVAELKAQEKLQIKFAMEMWGFGEAVPAEGDCTYQIFWNAILAKYNGNVDEAVGTEGFNTTQHPNDYATTQFVAQVAPTLGNVKYDSISGITAGKEGDLDTVTIVIDGRDPKAIWNFSIPIAPMKYYAGEAIANAINAGGAGNSFREQIWKNETFMKQLRTNFVPYGAGVYQVTTANGGTPTSVNDFFNAGVIYMKRNDSFMMGAAKIKYLRYKEVTSGQEYNAVLTGDVHYSAPSASNSLIGKINAGEGKNADLSYDLVDNLGYGYIGLNASYIRSQALRQAIMMSMNRELCITNYYEDLATVIEYPMSKISWAYPEDAKPVYPFDESGSKILKKLTDEGFEVVDGKVVFTEATVNALRKPDGSSYQAGDQLVIDMTLPAAADTHPAGSIFLSSKTVFESIGVKVNVTVDEQILNKLGTENNGVLIWAAAWQSTIDPDLFQVYYSGPENTATSPVAYGLFDMFKNGSEAEKATLARINELITQGRQTLNVDERKGIYNECLKLIMDIAVELPTYQRKNMFVYNSKVINKNTLVASENITPYWGPLSELWNVEFNA